jgi:2-polyprenyl-3-methyl-5-hydroxy-6-metoxy-1,4-benzoquinol methylase
MSADRAGNAAGQNGRVTSDDGSDQADLPAFSARWWEQHYQGHESGAGAPSPYVVDLTALPIGTALDAGCGNGADAIWLAGHGWEVTAVDVSPTAIQHAEELAAEQAPDVPGRITWVVADLSDWEPPQQYDLVVSQYVHPGVPFDQFVARLARAVAPDGTLLVVGHDHADRHSAAHAPEQASIGLDTVTRPLSSDQWDIDVAEIRTRQATHDSSQLTMHDLVVRAHRTPSR